MCAPCMSVSTVRCMSFNLQLLQMLNAVHTENTAVCDSHHIVDFQIDMYTLYINFIASFPGLPL